MGACPLPLCQWQCRRLVRSLFPLQSVMTEPNAHMAEPTAEVHNPESPAADSQLKPTTQPETILQDILDTMQSSDLFPRTGKDVASGFWSSYERVAKQHDDEFLDRQNGEMDALLIFAGLFSSVSSAFIVNMTSSLSPQPSDTTNALLKVLINKIDNGTFSEQEASLPVWTGPSSTIIWIQTLVYTSLSMSLLAAFGAVLGKQWLAHFKTSRFGRGALHERCRRRQQKLDGLKTWHFHNIIAALPILLQLSLLFFGIALAGNIWIQQHTVASVILGTTSFGVIFYFFTLVASLKSPDCPFQTPVSTILSRLLHVFRETIVVWAHRARPNSWADFQNGLREFLRNVFISGKHLITRSIARLSAYLSRLWLALRQRILSILSPTDDPERAGNSEKSMSFEEYDLYDLDYSSEPVGARSIQWIIETSTDIDVFTTAVKMVPEVEWPDESDVTFVLDQLTSCLQASFRSPLPLTPHMRERAQACLKAIFHLYTERGLLGPLNIRTDNIFHRNRHLYVMPRGQDFELISCVVDRPNGLDITSIQSSDLMWMARILTYRLHNGVRFLNVLAFVHNFISKSLNDPKTPSRLVADCLVLAGLIIGLRPDRQYLAKIDKSATIQYLQGFVIDHMLYLLLGEASVSQIRYSSDARKLLQPLSNGLRNHDYGPNYRISILCLKVCFRLLEDPDTDETQAQLADVSAAIRLSLLYSLMIEERRIWTFLYRRMDQSFPYWGGPPTWHTQAQFDLLLDYLVQVSQGTDYTTIGDAFAVLAGLRGSPSTLERKRVYIETIIRFMGSEIPLRTRHAAMSAASAVRTEVASLGRDDEPLRDLFSQALISVVLACDPAVQQTSASVDNSPFNELSIFNWDQNWHYLGILSALSKEPTWHGQLDCNGHFRNCIVIANSLSSRLRTNEIVGELTVVLTHIFATVDALGKEHQFLRSVRNYTIWPVILRAWRHMFGYSFFYEATDVNWEQLSSWGVVESLPAVAAYAMKYLERWDNRPETYQLIQLVEQVCGKLNEEKQRSMQNISLVEPGQENDKFGYQGIPNLCREIRELLDILSGDN